MACLYWMRAQLTLTELLTVNCVVISSGNGLIDANTSPGPMVTYFWDYFLVFPAYCEDRSACLTICLLPVVDKTHYEWVPELENLYICYILLQFLSNIFSVRMYFHVTLCAPMVKTVQLKYIGFFFKSFVEKYTRLCLKLYHVISLDCLLSCLVSKYLGIQPMVWLHMVSWNSASDMTSQHMNTSGSPHKGSVMRSFNVFFDITQNKLLDKQSICRWFETP